AYYHDHFFDASLLFGEYHRELLEKGTSSRTRFLISGSATIKDGKSPPKAKLASKIIYFDQPAGALLPASVKSKILDMLANLLLRFPGLSLTVKPHPVGADSLLRGFLASVPSARLLPANDAKSVADHLASHGLSFTAFSTTGLEAIASGTASLFLNPERALECGPLAFMSDYVVPSGSELVEAVSRLVSEEEHYVEFTRLQKAALGRHYFLDPFDYRGFLEELGLQTRR
ncbi:MAG: hypothetical protein ABI036_11205, partial [Fibrobacteria bacterium]